MTAAAHRFTIEVQDAEGSLVGTQAASIGACLDDARFDAVRAGRVANDGRLPDLRVTPEWDSAGRPAVTGLQVSLAGSAARRYGREVFAAQVRAFAQRLRAEGRAAEGVVLAWRVVAHETDAPRAQASHAPFPLEPAALPHVERGAYQLCIAAPLLRDVQRRIAAARGVEEASLLLGRLRHDAARAACELEVVDEIPLAPGAGGASGAHFAFEPRSFVEARRIAGARSDGARPCGWLHSHVPCADCRKQPDCAVDWVFFSTDDVEVQSGLFASPQMVALVGGKVGHLPARRPGFRLYGWREARVVERGFRVRGAGAEAWRDDEGSFGDEPAPEPAELEEVAWTPGR